MKTILDVGQCAYDGPRMTQMLQAKAGVRVETADTLDEAAEKLSGNAYDLVLVNRELAADESSGLELVAWMKEQGLATPVMLVSDLPEAQERAMQLGAVKGFGKSRINDVATVKLIKKAMKL